MISESKPSVFGLCRQAFGISDREIQTATVQVSAESGSDLIFAFTTIK